MWVRGLKLCPVAQTWGAFKSHPVWVRGLKPHSPLPGVGMADVAPRVGAWIETILSSVICIIILSHPVWVFYAVLSVPLHN